MDTATLQQPTIIGQLRLMTYTVILLGFHVGKQFSREAIVAELDKASLKLTKAFPFLAGQIVLEGVTATSTGFFKNVPYKPHTGKSLVRVKDCSRLCPSYEEIKSAKAPISMLDGEILSPKKGFNYLYDPLKDELPLEIIQANFIEGGLLLCFVGEHNSMDMNGQAQIIRLFAAACRGEEFDNEAVTMGNIDASTMVPFLRDGETKLEHQEFRVPSTMGQGEAQPPRAPSPAPWKMYRIPAKKAAQLKHEASRSLSEDVRWISTNDAITAFYWKCLVRARRKRLPDVEDCTMLRAVNGRRRLDNPISDCFMGDYVAALPTTQPVDIVLTAPLATIAGELRKSVAKVNEQYIRSLASTLRDEPDKTTFSWGALMKSGMDILISSFADTGVLHCSFGPVLGTADFARRPQLDDAEGIVYMMPKTAEMDYDLCASLQVADFEALEADTEWADVAETIG